MKITIIPDHNNPHLERWMVDFKQSLQENPDLTETENIKPDFPEDGSLVVWAKMTSSVLNDKTQFQNTVDKYVNTMFQKHPFQTDRETKLSIKIEVLNNIEGKIFSYFTSHLFSNNTKYPIMRHINLFCIYGILIVYQLTRKIT